MPGLIGYGVGGVGPGNAGIYSQSGAGGSPAGILAAAGGAGVDVTTSAQGGASTPVPQTTQTIDELLSATQIAEEQYAEYQAETAQYNGDIAEEGAYTNAEAVANQNERLATVSGQVQQAQEARQIVKTIGSQQAAVAGAGLGAGGTAAYLLRDSRAQGTLAEQLIGVNAAVASGGYSAQAAAAAAEAAAVSAAASVASSTAKTAYTDYQNSKTNALNYAASLAGGATGGYPSAANGWNASLLGVAGGGQYTDVINNITATLKALGQTPSG